MRRHDVNNINLRIEYVEICEQTIYIKWSSDIGFGEYTIYQSDSDPKEWIIDSECMDSQDDKEFGAALLKLWLKSMTVRG